MTTTVAHLADAQRLARAILGRRLAACVQLEPGIVSLYRWQGQWCEEPEVRLTIKTVAECAPALQALFAELHPYEVPQWLATRLAASPGYARWVATETAFPPDVDGAGPDEQS